MIDAELIVEKMKNKKINYDTVFEKNDSAMGERRNET